MEAAHSPTPCFTPPLPSNTLLPHWECVQCWWPLHFLVPVNHFPVSRNFVHGGKDLTQAYNMASVRVFRIAAFNALKLVLDCSQ